MNAEIATTEAIRTHAGVSLRSGRREDASYCGRICYEAFKTIAGHHNFPEDFPSSEIATGLMDTMLSNPTVRSAVAELNGRVVGSNFVWQHPPVAGIGPITVDPESQNASIGRRLMEDALAFARDAGFQSVRLVQATYHSRSLSLYTKLGFVVREPLSTIQGPAIGAPLPGHAVRPAVENDVEACNHLCMRIHGHARGHELREAIRQGSAMVVERAGRLTGYATLVGFFGHAVAESNDDLKSLIGAAPSFPGPGFLLPSRNAEVFRWCLDNGLHVVQPLTLMSIGMYNEPAGPFLPSILY